VDSSVEEKFGSGIDSSILSMKRTQQRYTFTSNFAELGKHLSKNWRQKLPTMDIHTL
jgi:hypothetical protein